MRLIEVCNLFEGGLISEVYFFGVLLDNDQIDYRVSYTHVEKKGWKKMTPEMSSLLLEAYKQIPDESKILFNQVLFDQVFCLSHRMYEKGMIGWKK